LPPRGSSSSSPRTAARTSRSSRTSCPSLVSSRTRHGK
jgi:hypothetical protein